MEEENLLMECLERSNVIWILLLILGFKPKDDTDNDALIQKERENKMNENWISVNEKLPFAEYGESKNVITTCEFRDQDTFTKHRWIKVLYYNGGNWCYPTGETYEELVVAWMPLPEPYSGS